MVGICKFEKGKKKKLESKWLTSKGGPMSIIDFKWVWWEYVWPYSPFSYSVWQWVMVWCWPIRKLNNLRETWMKEK